MFVSNNGHMKIIGKCQIPLLDMMIRNIIIMILMKMLMKNGSKEEMDKTRYIFNKKKKKSRSKVLETSSDVMLQTTPNSTVSSPCQNDA